MFFYFHRGSQSLKKDLEDAKQEYYTSNVYKLLKIINGKRNEKKYSSNGPYNTYGTHSHSYSRKNKVKTSRRNDAESHAGMERKEYPSVTPYYAAGIIGVLYALVSPMYRWGDFVAAACVITMVFCILKKVCKPQKIWVPIRKEKSSSEKKESVSTGNPEIDRIIKEGTEALKRLHKANEQIENPEISKEINRMEEISFHIFAYVCDHPQKASQIRRFLNYYLPTTLKLLESYGYLAKQDVNGENISSSMRGIEDIIKNIVLAFEKQLDALFSDEAFDISADISVMESMLQQEGIFVERKKEKESL